MNLLTARDLRMILNRMTYKPGWEFALDTSDPIQFVLVITATVQDVHDRWEEVQVTNRQWMPYFALSGTEEFKDFVRHEIRRMEEHEIDEWLKFDGKHYRDPHPELTRK